MSIDRDRTSLKDVLRASDKAEHQEVSLPALEAAARLRGLALTVAHRVDAAFQASQGAFTHPALFNLGRFQRNHSNPVDARPANLWAPQHPSEPSPEPAHARPGSEAQATRAPLPWSALHSARASAAYSATPPEPSARQKAAPAHGGSPRRESQAGKLAPAFHPAPPASALA